MRKLLAALLLAAPVLANAADLQLTVEVPRLDVAEYHRPYVAVWIETAEGQVVGDIAHWYQQPGKGSRREQRQVVPEWRPLREDDGADLVSDRGEVMPRRNDDWRARPGDRLHPIGERL